MYKYRALCSFQPKNIFLSYMPNGRLQAKVGDFGLSRQIYSPSSSPEAGRHPPMTPHPGLASPPPVDVCSVPSWCSLTSGVGTAIYAAPEQLTGSAYSQKVRARLSLAAAP